MTENFHFWSCDLEKSADSSILAQNELISETVRETDKILGSPKEKNIFDENIYLWSCDLEKVPFLQKLQVLERSGAYMGSRL